MSSGNVHCLKAEQITDFYGQNLANTVHILYVFGAKISHRDEKQSSFEEQIQKIQSTPRIHQMASYSMIAFVP